MLEHDDLKAELALLETQLKFANKNKFRSQQIFDEKGISEQELDNIILQNQELEARKQILLAEIAKHKIVAPFSGIVGLKEAGVNTSNRSLLFRAKYANNEETILAGSFSKVKVTVERFDNAVFIPNQAIIPELNGKKVFLYKNGVVHETKIESGIRKANFTHITDGIKTGDTLVTAGILQIRDNAPATIRETKTFDYNF